MILATYETQMLLLMLPKCTDNMEKTNVQRASSPPARE